MGYSIVSVDELEPGGEASAVFRFDPETVRQPVAGPDRLTMIAVGARPGGYEPHGPF